MPRFVIDTEHTLLLLAARKEGVRGFDAGHWRPMLTSIWVLPRTSAADRLVTVFPDQLAPAPAAQQNAVVQERSKRLLLLGFQAHARDLRGFPQ